MEKLYKAVWLVNNEEDQLTDDKQIEIDEQEVDIESNTNSTSPGPELTFINVDPSAFSASSSHKKKQAGKGLQKPSGKKKKLHDILHDDIDEEIDKLLLRKLKKTKTSAAQGKQVHKQSISPSNAGNDDTVDEDAVAPRKFMVYIQDTGNPNNVEKPVDFNEEAGLEQGMTSKKALIVDHEYDSIVPLTNTMQKGMAAKQMRISMWATSIATTLVPPMSLHFADNKKLKMLSSVTQPASDAPISTASSTAANVPHAFPPAPAGYGFHPGHYYPPHMPQAPFTGPPMQEQAQGFGGPPLPEPPEFCIKYNISASDQAKFLVLKYMPGN
ncbi:hypothetical protein BDR06DRAFT_977238 [Suillus hirtellus]|nr:hypothetical protein BDR06DRAFT_977238 [Suillus hirtellus]